MEWRTIEEFPDYVVSEAGDVKRAFPDGKGNLTGKPLKPSRLRTGYLSVGLFRDAIANHRLIHRLVAFAFLGVPPTPKHEVAHGDGTRVNNHRSNLRWATREENKADRILHGTDQNGERNPRAKLTEEQVKAIKSELDSDHCRLHREIADEYGVSRVTIGHIKAGVSWAHVDQDEHGVVGVAKPRRAAFLKT